MIPYIFSKTSKDDTAIAAMRLSEAARWRRKTFSEPWVDSDFLSDLNTGCFYFGGRDKALRPLFVARLDRVLLQDWDQDRMIRLIIFMLEFERHHLLIPGVCEQHVLLLDLRNVGLLDITGSRTLIAKIASVISSYYVGMNYKILIVNPPASLQTAWGVVSGLLSEGQLAKACVVTSQSTILKDLFAPHQLEQTYGGTRPGVRGPYYPFQFVAGPFEVTSQGPDETTPSDIYSRLLRPPWAVWKSKDSEHRQQLKLELTDRTGKLLRCSSDASACSIKTIGSFKSALSRCGSFKSDAASHHSFFSVDSASTLTQARISCHDAKSTRRTVEESNHQPNGKTHAEQGWALFSGPDCCNEQKRLSEQATAQDEAIDFGKVAQSTCTPDGAGPSDDNPLATGSTDAPREVNPQGVFEEDEDEWGFAESPDAAPPVVFFEVAPERLHATQQKLCCFWPFCCPTGSPL